MRLLKLLYVEDDDHYVRLFKKALPLDMREDRPQYFLDTARTIEIAQALIRFTHYDAIFADDSLDYDQKPGGQMLRELIEAGFRNPAVLLSRDGQPKLDAETMTLVQKGRILHMSKSYLNSENIEEFVAYVLGRKISLLHVEDDEDDALITRELLGKAHPIQFDLTRVSTLGEAREAISDRQWDVVLVDWLMQEGCEAGSATTEELIEKLAPRHQDTSLVILSGQRQELLSEAIVRQIGRRNVSYCGKSDLSTTKLVNAIMSHRNGRAGLACG